MSKLWDPFIDQIWELLGLKWLGIRCVFQKKRGWGGLGIKRITEWNKNALLKHIWNLCNDSNGSIWSTCIRSNLLPGRNFWKIKAPKNCSSAWGKILKLRSLTWPKMKYTIGDERETSQWFDNWHPHSRLTNSYDERFNYDWGMGKNTMVNVLVSL